MVQTRRSKARVEAEEATTPSQPLQVAQESSRKRKRGVPNVASAAESMVVGSSPEVPEPDQLPLRAKGGGVKIVFSDNEDETQDTGEDSAKLDKEPSEQSVADLRTPAAMAKAMKTSTSSPQGNGDPTTPTPSKQILAEASTGNASASKTPKEAAREDGDSDSDEAPEAITQTSAKAALKAASRTQNEAITSSSVLEKSKRKEKAEKLQAQAQAAQRRKERKEKKELRRAAKAAPEEDEKDEEAIDPENLPAFLPDSILEAAAAAESRALTTLPSSLSKQPTKRKFNDDDDDLDTIEKREGADRAKRIVLPYEKQAALSKKLVKKGDSVYVKVLDDRYGRDGSKRGSGSSIAPRMKKGGATQAREKWLLGRGAVARTPVNAGFVRR